MKQQQRIRDTQKLNPVQMEQGRQKQTMNLQSINKPIPHVAQRPGRNLVPASKTQGHQSQKELKYSNSQKKVQGVLAGMVLTSNPNESSQSLKSSHSGRPAQGLTLSKFVAHKSHTNFHTSGGRPA